MLDTYKFCVIAKEDIYGIIVDGNLTVNGVLFQPDIDNGEHAGHRKCACEKH
ncbi:hypothetical protein [Chitinophaga pinensis]|uniref:hypothetical protein n=1 Tax=Chitinophaga pinensis TaxID=79329 RepID=UPI0021BD96FF|nr:hypothetical protein [Chitinophaga pinensis]